MLGFSQPQAAGQSNSEPIDEPKVTPSNEPKVASKNEATSDRGGKTFLKSSPKRRSSRTQAASRTSPTVQSSHFSPGDDSPGCNVFSENDKKPKEKKTTPDDEPPPGDGGGDDPN